MHARYSKNEIHERIFWVNNFRLFFGLAFFVLLILLNALNVSLSVDVLLLIMIGTAILVYSLLSFAYLATQRPALNELIFFSVFLAMLDLAIITIFVYFSGGYQSPYFVFYLLALTSVVMGVPYMTFSVFLLAGAASVFYDLMIFFTNYDRVLPFYSRLLGRTPLTGPDVLFSWLSALIIPLIIFFFAAGFYAIARFMENVRLENDSRVDAEKDAEKSLSSFSQVFFVLTHVFKPAEMLAQALGKLLEILNLNSGLVLVLDADKKLALAASANVPRGVIDNFVGKSFKEMEDLPPNLKGIVLGGELIHNWSLWKMVFHNKPQGLLVFFGREGESWIDPRYKESLEAVADEMAAAVYYSSLFKKLSPKAKE